MVKTEFHLGKLDSCSLKPGRKTHRFIYLFIETATLVKYLSFLKETCCFPLLCWEVMSYTTISPKQGNSRYGSQHSQCILSWPLFYGMGQCVLAMSLQSSETAEEHIFVILAIGVWWQKRYFPLEKAWYLQPQNCQENNLVHFSLHNINNFSQVFQFFFFFKETDHFSLLAGNSSDITVSPN